jgi:hypothetical protein
MFKINHELSKNPMERLLIIKKIINLNNLHGGNVDFSNTTHNQLDQLTSNLYTMNSRLINGDDTYGTQVIELLNNINKYIHNSDINKLILYLYKLVVLIDKNILTNYKNYKTTLKTIIDTLEQKDKKTSHKELLNVKRNLKLLMDTIREDPFLKQHQYEYLPTDDRITKKNTTDIPDKNKDFLLSKTSASLKQDTDSLSVLSVQENKNKRVDEEDIKSLYLSETERNLIYMLLQAIGIKNIDTWDIISEKYKVLYNKIILGDTDSPDIKDSTFMYSYNDIAFVQNIINFNYFGLINWEMATLNMKKYIDDLFLVLKGNKIEEKEIINKTNIEDNEDDVDNDDVRTRESGGGEEEEEDSGEEDSEEEDSGEEDSEEEDSGEEDSEEEDSEEEDSENDSEEDIKKIISK